MADLTQFGWAVLDSIVTKADRMNQGVPVTKVDKTVLAELLGAKLVYEVAGRPKGPGRGRHPGVLWPTDEGKRRLAAHKSGQMDMPLES